MRSLSCQWQRVVKTNMPLDYISIDQDTNAIYGSFNNVILRFNYDNQEVCDFVLQ